MDFVKQYNAATETQRGNIIPVEITIYEDRIVHLHHQDAAGARELIKKAAGRGQGQRRAAQDQGRHDHAAQVREIAQTKMPDLNATTIEAAEKIIAGHRPLDGHQRRRLMSVTRQRLRPADVMWQGHARAR